MRKIFIFIPLFFLAVIVSGQTYTPTDAGSKVKFIIKNFGINTGGSFDGLKGSINFDAANLASASFNVTVDAASVDTDMDARDKHLRKEEYFDVEKYPTISFKSSKITKTNKEGFLYMFGTLTIKGVSKEISFPFTHTAKDGGLLFDGEFKINRRDYGVGGKSFSMADELTVHLQIFAKKN